ncbi:MAG: hypothetical protein BGO51_22125 [Rhodospirillales bacterium 69-11]|nr:hypothetical protein [Rhodospirillales bacterium]OJW20542.1 MAG: hypothetical protein BGO51_22125 [Rhodospirillales bacterium 69-11]
MKAILGLILNWVVSRLLGGGDTQTRNDDIALGRAQNELEHVKQENTDRAALDSVEPVSPDAAADSLRHGEF